MTKLLSILLFFTIGLCFGQAPDVPSQLETKSSDLTETELEPGETYVIDTVIDGKAIFKKEIPLANPENNNRELLDDTLAASIDEKWREAARSFDR